MIDSREATAGYFRNHRLPRRHGRGRVLQGRLDRVRRTGTNGFDAVSQHRKCCASVVGETRAEFRQLEDRGDAGHGIEYVGENNFLENDRRHPVSWPQKNLPGHAGKQ